MAEPLTPTSDHTVTQAMRNNRIVRAGRCWDCIGPTKDTVGGWKKCATCDRAWRIVSPTLIVERNALPKEITGKHARLLSAGQKVVWNVNTINAGQHIVTPDDQWLIPVGSYIEGDWHTEDATA